jgi:hypothetical protein
MYAIHTYHAYILLGIHEIINDRPLPNWYVGIFIFMVFKIVAKYEKCTISYLECKLRGVRKEEGYINRLLQSFIYMPINVIELLLFTTLFIFYQTQIKNIRLI